MTARTSTRRAAVGRGDLSAVSVSSPVESDPVSVFYSGKGKIEGDALALLLDTARGASTGHESASSQVSTLTDQIGALTKARAEATAERDRHQVTVQRLAFLLCTPEVRGVASMRQADFASALGVSRVAVTHHVNYGRRLFQVAGAPKGKVTSGEVRAVKALTKARKAPAPVQREIDAAIERDRKASKTYTPADLATTVEAVLEDTKRAATGRPTIALKVKTFEHQRQALANADLTVSAADRAVILAHLARIVALVEGATVTEPNKAATPNKGKASA